MKAEPVIYTLASAFWFGVSTPAAKALLGSSPGDRQHLTRKASLADPLQIVELKGLIAGPCILGLGLWMGNVLPQPSSIALAGLVGLLGYGISLALFVLALRHMGMARTGAYFSNRTVFWGGRGGADAARADDTATSSCRSPDGLGRLAAHHRASRSFPRPHVPGARARACS